MSFICGIFILCLFFFVLCCVVLCWFVFRGAVDAGVLLFIGCVTKSTFTD